MVKNPEPAKRNLRSFHQLALAATLQSVHVGNPEVSCGQSLAESFGVGRHRIGRRGIPMLYKKISVEVIVLADEGEAVVGELNATLDRLEDSHSIFGGGIETLAFEHPGKRRRSALAHTVAAGVTVSGALKTARDGMTAALRMVI
jgi:hypothetical protein